MELPKRLKRRLQKVAHDLREAAKEFRERPSPDGLALADELESFANLVQSELRKMPYIRSFVSVVAGLQEGATA